MTNTFDDMSKVFSDLFERPIVLKPEMTSADVVGWDSFRHVEILLELEAKYDIFLPTTEVAKANTIGDLVALVDRKRSA